MAKIKERGFALVEVGAALPVLIVAIGGVFAVVYLCIAQAWLKDAAEEAALCVAEKVSVSVCKREFAQKTHAALPVGAFSRLTIERYNSQIVVKYVYQSLQLNLENELYLSLPVSKRAVGKL